MLAGISHISKFMFMDNGNYGCEEMKWYILILKRTIWLRPSTAPCRRVNLYGANPFPEKAKVRVFRSSLVHSIELCITL